MSAKVLHKALAGPSDYRVLELHPGTRSSPLRASLFQADLTKPCVYEALSYRWSAVDPDKPAYIEIDNVSLSIGPGLHAALVQFRSQSLPRNLWIDQICINQIDIEEKLQQIKIMGNIYSGAQTVLVWLGDASDQSNEAMESFPSFVEELHQADEDSMSQQPSEPRFDPFERWGSLVANFNKLLSRAWFGRLWTLQEAALGQRAQVWCGNKSFSFDVLRRFVEGCYNDTNGYWSNVLRSIGSGSGSSDPENPNRSPIAHIQVISALSEGGRTSSRILNSLRILDCSEHQDRIYSVLRFLDAGLVKEILEKQMQSPSELYHFVAIHELKRGELEFLGAAGLAQHRISYQANSDNSIRPFLSIPSWVPDWTYTIRTHSYWVHNNECLRRRGRPIYTAGGPPLEEQGLTFSNDFRVLGVSGIIVGEISEVGPPFRILRLSDDRENLQRNFTTAMTGVNDYRSYIASCMELADKCASNYGASNVTRACRHSLVASMMPDGSSTTLTGVLVRASDEAVDALFEDFQAQASVLDEFAWLSHRMENGTPFTRDEYSRMARCTAAAQSLGSFSSKNNLMQAMAEACKGRRFFITGANLFMGIAPDISCTGDKICIIPGCCAPFVVRPQGSHYQLIGECYVAGLMDGEFVDDKNFVYETILLE